MLRSVNNGSRFRDVTLVSESGRCPDVVVELHVFFRSALLHHMLVLTECLHLPSVQPGTCMLGGTFTVSGLKFSGQSVVAESTNTLACML